ncbi:hypothetical protein Q5Y75_24000 [Ruegeria sp. 2205SS24-7]|uniref:hypothetical protein n=1 Tax=Ruegeria discodermiae TaxID=3064389 RepID=UPI0027424F28|nr:hypothetical protein [Ruegeria sp. 2205SS24-7]MDP5220258.1 hypothetical protein [Ruegeria sp. 2205SS24-7]
MTAGHPTKAGDDYLELYRSTITSVNSIIGALSAFLVLLILSIIIPIDGSVAELKRLNVTDGSQMETLVVRQVENRLAKAQQVDSKGRPVVINKMNILIYADDREARA